MNVYRTEMTPLLFLERSQKVYDNRIGAVYGARRFTYGEIGARARILATALAKAGIRRGDRVAFLAPNLPAILEAHFGVALAGGILVAMNTRLNAAEVGYILEHSGSRLFFVDAELAQGVSGLRGNAKTVEQTILDGQSAEVHSAREGMGRAGQADPLIEEATGYGLRATG